MGFENESVKMHTPSHPGEIMSEVVSASGWTVSEVALQLGIEERELSRLLSRKIGISPAMALAFECFGWNDADFWMRLQASWELARECRRQAAA